MKRRVLLSYMGTAVAMALLLGAVPAFAGIVPEVLKDGTKIEIDGDKVFLIGGVDPCIKPQRTAAKDGSYTLKNGKTIEVKNGKLVSAVRK